MPGKLKSKQAVLATAFLLAIIILFWLYKITINNQQIHSWPNEEPVLLGDDDIEEVATMLAKPIQLSIPAISLTADFTTPLGLLPNGEVEVPEDDGLVGWYQFSPLPGRPGPAVILGHVDSYIGPAVFHRLGQLQVGDEIIVNNSDGSSAVFLVTELERPTQVSFPTAKVYGDIDHVGLRLITCTGVYISGRQRYTHNLIVYARLRD